MMLKGDLVVHGRGYYAIVLDVAEPEVTLFFSNGLTAVVLCSECQRLPLKVGAEPGGAYANFAEVLCA